ncbi:MAG: hypothetical protein ACUVWZ_09940 [Anaerolineae bacterium]
MKVVLWPQRPLAGGKDFEATTVRGTGRTGQGTGVGADLDLLDAVRSRELMRRLASQGQRSAAEARTVIARVWL